MPRRSYYCKLCNDFKCSTTEDFRIHLETEHHTDILDYYETYDKDTIPFRIRRQMIARYSKAAKKSSSESSVIVYRNEISNNKIRCPLCSFVGSVLSRHIRSHGLNTSEFLEKYPDCRLVSQSYHDLRSKCLTKTLRSEWSKENYRLAQSNRLKIRSSNPNDQLVVNKIANGGHRVEYISRDGKTYKMRSHWETYLAHYLDKSEVKWEYESLLIKLSQSFYYPDFYLPDYNAILEVKRDNLVDDELVQDKKKSCIELGYKYLFMTSEDIYSDNPLSKLMELS